MMPSGEYGMSEQMSALDRGRITGFDWEPHRTERSRHRSLRARGARLFATCAQGAWVLLAVTPVVVVLFAIS